MYIALMFSFYCSKVVPQFFAKQMQHPSLRCCKGCKNIKDKQTNSTFCIRGSFSASVFLFWSDFCSAVDIYDHWTTRRLGQMDCAIVLLLLCSYFETWVCCGHTCPSWWLWTRVYCSWHTEAEEAHFYDGLSSTNNTAQIMWNMIKDNDFLV